MAVDISNIQGQVDSLQRFVDQASLDIAKFCKKANADDFCGFFGYPKCGDLVNPATCATAQLNFGNGKQALANAKSILGSAGVSQATSALSNKVIIGAGVLLVVLGGIIFIIRRRNG